MITTDSGRSSPKSGPGAMPFLTPPLMPWTGSRPASATTPRLTAEQIEAIIRNAEGWAREERTRTLIARLNALRPCPHVHVPADWRERLGPGGDA